MSLRLFVTAVALAIVFEGLLPFLSPRLFRQGLAGMLQLGDRALRIMGLAALVVGVALLYVVRLSG